MWGNPTSSQHARGMDDIKSPFNGTKGILSLSLSLQTYLHWSAEVAVVCQGRHVRAAALCSDSSSDVLISAFTQHLLTSLSWRMGMSERTREREGGM